MKFTTTAFTAAGLYSLANAQAPPAYGPPGGDESPSASAGTSSTLGGPVGSSSPPYSIPWGTGIIPSGTGVIPTGSAPGTGAPYPSSTPGSSPAGPIGTSSAPISSGPVCVPTETVTVTVTETTADTTTTKTLTSTSTVTVN